MSAQTGSFLFFIYVDMYKDLEFLILKREGFNILSLKCPSDTAKLQFQASD